MLHCVYASSGEKKCQQPKEKKKMFKEPDAKCIYLIIHSTPPSFPLSSTASGEKQRVGGGGRAGVGEKKRREKKKEAKVVVVVTPALCSRYHTNNTHTHTHPVIPLSPRLSGMTKIKALKKKQAAHKKSCSPNFSKMGMKREREGTKKKSRKVKKRKSI